MIQEDYLEKLLSLPNISPWLRPKVSRDGKWVAWTWFQTGPAADVFAVPVDGSLGPIRLSNTAEDTYLVSWTPDSKAVIVAQDKSGDERDQLFRIDIDRPLEMVPLTEPDPQYFLRGGELHPNGRWLVYGANFDLHAGAEIEPTWIYRHDLESGERKILARPEKANYLDPHISPDGRAVLYNRKDLHPAGSQVWLVDIDGQADREILNFGPALKTYASWFPDSKRVLVLSETETHRRIGIWTLDGGSITWLVDDPERNIEDAYVPFGSDEIVLISVSEAQTQASLLHPGSGLERDLACPGGNLVPLAPCAAGEWLGFFYNSQHPADVVRFDLDDLNPARFTNLCRVWERTTLEPADLIKAEPYRWSSVDSLNIQGWLYCPHGEPKGTIVTVHGGPSAHSQDRINPQVQLFACAGFAVLDPNYRGSTGFGLAFREAIKEEGWGGLEQEDIRAGIEALIAAGLARAGKVGITGTSYGGYSSWWAITHFPAEIVAAAAPICGMTDLVVDYETTRPDLRPYSEEMMGGSPEEIPEKYHERSPINFVTNIQGRLLIVQGGQDPNVTPENVRQVRRALDEAGMPYQILIFDDEGHGISKIKNQKTLYLALLEFFDRGFSNRV